MRLFVVSLTQRTPMLALLAWVLVYVVAILTQPVRAQEASPPCNCKQATLAPQASLETSIVDANGHSIAPFSDTEIYEVSTRHLPDRFRSIQFENPNVEVNRWTGVNWARSTIDEALPAWDDKLSIIYVHGNFMERSNALQRVRIVDGYLRAKANQPYRLIMLSWPSQREPKPLRDIIANAEAAECESLYMAWLLHRLRHVPRVSILGFSFGARAVTGGLHLDAGGRLPGFQSISTNNLANRASNPYRVALVAPALDRNWIEPNGRHGLALTNVDSVVNLYNSRDPVLRRFRFLDRLARPIAAGFAGFEAIADPRATSPLSGQPRIRQYDCGSVIGTTHSEKSYYGECPYFGKVIEHLLWLNSSNILSLGPSHKSEANACTP
jgi:hypothetical protein